MLVVSTAIVPEVFAQQSSSDWGKVRSIYTADYNLFDPKGIAFSPIANAFLLWDANNNITGIGMREVPVGSAVSNIPVENALNVAFDAHTNSIFALNTQDATLEKISVGKNGRPTPSGKTSKFNINSVGLKNPGIFI